MIGRVVGNYRILAELGAGGMGLVYKAQDVRLERFLALKFLKPERVSDEFRRRFLQEARASSALHHPAIVHIYDIGQWEGRDYIAMEYVEGSTLHAILHKRALSVDEALAYAVQVADALTVAHAAGIVHRDLKPGNLMVTPEGHIKVLDFGLAKLAPAKTGPEGSPSDSTEAETVTSSQTVPGIPIGSPAYMSPEQAAGKAVDARTDIFAFGAVLFEMLTGRRAFTGDSLIEVMGAVLHAQVPPASSINPRVNHDLDSVVARCLEKKPAARFQEMSEVARALKTKTRGALVPAFRRRPVRRAMVGLVLAALLAAAFFLYRRRLTPAPERGPATAERLTFDAGVNIEPSVSADGNFVAYASDRAGKDNLDIWLKQIHGGDPIQLTFDPANDHSPDVSPDGTSVAFRSERKGGGIYLVPALGGRETLLVPEGRRPRFSPDGQQIVYWKGADAPYPLRAGSGNTFVYDRATLRSRPIAADFAAATDPVWSPDGKSILFVGLKDAGDVAHTFDWWIVPVDGGAPVKCPVLTATLYVPYAWLGDYVYYESEDTTIHRIRLDAKTRQPAGRPENLTPETADESGPSPAAGGRLVFASMVQKTNLFKLPLDADLGRVTGGPQSITNDLGENLVEAISANGQRIAFVRIRGSGAVNSVEIWGADLAAGGVHALVTGDLIKGMLSISPDGASVTWRETYGSVGQIMATPFEGGVSSKLCDGCAGVAVWSPDGKRVLYGSATAADTVLIREIGTGKESVYLRGGSRELRPTAISRDGRWLAFAAMNRGNRADYAVYVAPFRPDQPPAEAEWVKVLSPADGYPIARWSPDGNLLYFFSRRDGHNCLWALRLDPRTKRPAGEPFAVRHFHSPALELSPGSTLFVGPAIAPERAVVTLSENSSSLWLLNVRQ